MFDGFMISLGVGAVATALVVLSGASWIVAASTGVGAMLAYGLFQRASGEQQDLPNQLMLSAT